MYMMVLLVLILYKLLVYTAPGPRTLKNSKKICWAPTTHRIWLWSTLPTSNHNFTENAKRING